jgi:hypothetical protein
LKETAKVADSKEAEVSDKSIDDLMKNDLDCFELIFSINMLKLWVDYLIETNQNFENLKEKDKLSGNEDEVLENSNSEVQENQPNLLLNYFKSITRPNMPSMEMMQERKNVYKASSLQSAFQWP